MIVENAVRAPEDANPFETSDLFEPWKFHGAQHEWINSQTTQAVDHCLARLDARAGERVLEVQTGTGRTARRLARMGVKVAAIDTRPELIGKAARPGASQGVDWRVGSSESLPFPNASFDAVVSTFGAMQISDPGRAARELARVTRHGGRIALATWPSRDGAWEMFEMVRSLGFAASATPSPLFDWGHSWWLEGLLGEYFDLRFEVGTSTYRARDRKTAWGAFADGNESIATLADAVGMRGLQAAASDFGAFHECHRTDRGIEIPRTYLITVGRRD